MGVIEFVQKFRNLWQKKKQAKMLNGYAPVYSQFGQSIYASDVVQQAISCITTEMRKLTPAHIRDEGVDPQPVSGQLQRLLESPNDHMTTADFLEKVTAQLMMKLNSFVIPTYRNEGGVRTYTGLYPVAPTNVVFMQDDSGRLFVRFAFASQYECTLRYSDVIHLKYRYGASEYMGGDEFGRPDHSALLKTLELNNTMLDGVGKALKSGFAVNGIIKYNTLLDDGKIDRAMAELEEHLKNSESGFLPLDLKGEFIPLTRNTQMVDEGTLKFIDSKILRHFGVPLAILTGDYTKEQYEAFYQKTLEPLIISLNQEFTRVLFTDRERSYGNKIKFYPHELVFMSTSQKIELFDKLVDTASCYKNELRVAFGMRPLPELTGQLAISSNKNNAINNDDGNGGTEDA